MEYEIILSNFKNDNEKKIENFLIELDNIKLKYANLNIFNNIKINYFDESVNLTNLITIQKINENTLKVTPFDKSILIKIQNIICKNDLGTPRIEKNDVIVNFPMITVEHRNILIKKLKTLSENFKIKIRNLRKNCNNDLKLLFKKKLINEDLYKIKIKEMEDLVKKSISTIDLNYKKKNIKLLKF